MSYNNQPIRSPQTPSQGFNGAQAPPQTQHNPQMHFIYNNQQIESIQNPLMDSKPKGSVGIEMQHISVIEPQDQEQDIPDTEREEDLKNLIGVLMGNVQLKRMEPALLLRLSNMEQYYDLLPFNIRGFRLVNRASLMEANFTEKYIIKQTQDLNLDLHKGQFEKHYLVDAAIGMTKNAPCWSFFVTLVILMILMLHTILDSLLMDTFTYKQPEIDAEIDRLKGIAHTFRDDEQQNSYENETMAISFLFVLLPMRLILWGIDLLTRIIALAWFRKKYILWTLLIDFIMICLTVVIGGFTTRLDVSLNQESQTRVELSLWFKPERLWV